MRVPRLDLRRLLTPERLAWAGLALVAVIAVSTAGRWWPAASALLVGADAAPAAVDAEPASAARGERKTIRLSEQARGTLGLQVEAVTLSDFVRTIDVPAVVAEIPGRTSLRVAAPMTGVLTDVLVTEGQAVEPGDPLFVLRLTHEDVVRAQTEYLTTLEALDVEDREIARLERAGSGVIAGKVVLERKYERQKLAGLLKARRQALLLHGLEEEQVSRIAENRNLIREVRIDVPTPHDWNDPDHGARHDVAIRPAALRRPVAPRQSGAAPGSAGSSFAGSSPERVPLTIGHLHGRPGDAVQAGDTLAELQDLGRLYIEGRAYAADAAAVTAAARQNRPVTAVPADGLLGTTGDPTDEELHDVAPIRDLQIVHVANEVSPDSRTLPFYVALPNTLLRESSAADAASGGGADGRFVTWRYKPGQRMRIRVPVERYENAIVLPTRAVTESGAERFVFVENGSTFEQRPVRVRFMDGERVVVANDGSVFPGEAIAVTGAYQLQMALKNQAGGAPDPHAGHNH